MARRSGIKTSSGGSEVEGFGALIESLTRARDRFGRYARQPKASVVYTAPYAVYVHEDLEMNHPIHAGGRDCGGEAKFLERPMREGRSMMARIIQRKLNLKRPKTLLEAMVAAAEWLLRASQRLVPVDTGALKESGKVVPLGGE